MAKTIIHKSESRGFTTFGWLKSHHTFSFGEYYNQERINFGELRVLNDDIVSGGKGFDMHFHENMEIISIPLYGELKHKDSLGNTHVISKGEVQVMSAGSGIYHSEYNKNEDHEVKFLQIWIFSNKQNVEPRYQQASLSLKLNNIEEIVCPFLYGKGTWIYQNAWIYYGIYEVNKTSSFKLNNKENGAYIFIIEGSVKINKNKLDSKDGIGIWDTDHINFEFSSYTEFILIETPMK